MPLTIWIDTFAARRDFSFEIDGFFVLKAFAIVTREAFLAAGSRRKVDRSCQQAQISGPLLDELGDALDASRRVERSCCGATRTEFDEIEGILVF